MSSRPTRRYGAITGASAAIFALALAGCGSDSLDTGGDKTSAPAGPTASVTKNASLADKVPADIKAKGTLNVATDASYPPNEYFGTDGKTIEGMDIEILNAVAGKLGLKMKYQNAGFDSIVLGVKSKKYDMAVSSLTINPERKQQVDFVSYFSAGTQWVTAKGNPKKLDPANACGKTISVQKGTVQITDLNKRSATCKAGGKPGLKLLIEDAQVKATTDLVSGRADGMAADLPVSVDAVTKNGGKLQLVGQNYDSAPYGFALPKGQTAFGNVLVEGLKAIKADGSYDAILKKWKTEGGSISNFAVNP
ncbi:ABC transporter substrate-binding protein [Luteipulveratus mongoliensis]|uniref:ABC transporter substrate-binding protein n=1 Tax=Luteipulveratus mongoliensis TaxID=571913 RepID=A0A0K1JLV4_9MICO|nr:ABC transporter substrate-binding protein [Luteipulveratus mongoliensis]AKU17563.1 ABC transporter substrate-binding protein [Luteipulveratus mongoliensis]